MLRLRPGVPAHGPQVFYTITITSLWVAVALVTGVIELISIPTDQLGIDSGPLAAIADLNLDDVGVVIMGLFVLARIVALVVCRSGASSSAGSATSPRAPRRPDPLGRPTP